MGNCREKETWVTAIAKLIILSIIKAISDTALVLGDSFGAYMEKNKYIGGKNLSISTTRLHLVAIIFIFLLFSCYFFNDKNPL